MLILDEVTGRHVVGAAANVGTTWPLHATSSGKAYMAFEEDGINKLGTDLYPLTAKTLTDREAIQPQLFDIRRRGYAVTVDELEEGFTAIATVIRGAMGDVQGTLSICGPSNRFGPSRRAELGASLCHAAARLSPDF
jgi:DNA-binding IclR family transcriptional regulator